MRQVDQENYDRAVSVVKVLLLAVVAFVITAVATVVSRGIAGRGGARA